MPIKTGLGTAGAGRYLPDWFEAVGVSMPIKTGLGTAGGEVGGGQLMAGNVSMPIKTGLGTAVAKAAPAS